MYDALLFDLDGTLIDTESLAIASGMQAFAEAGFPVDLDFLHRLIGVDQPSAGKIILAALPAIDLKTLGTRWNIGFQDRVDAGLDLKPGVLALLELAGHLPHAVVTSSSRREALRKLDVAGLAGRFVEVITLDDVTAAKPDPAPYLLAATRLGFAPARCLVFEDSETGAEAAHRAGCVVVQVPDVVPSTGKWAHHLATDLITGARAAGVVQAG